MPSPSALVILLSAIALGRTWFGVLLVVGYGFGMAGTLTAAGVLLVRARDRYQFANSDHDKSTWRCSAPLGRARAIHHRSARDRRRDRTAVAQPGWDLAFELS